MTALGHSWSILLDHKDATCEVGGYDIFECSRCGANDTTVIPAIGHSWSVTITPPTCTTQGSTTHTCANDATHNYVDSYTAATGHVWGVGVVTRQAPETAEGIRSFTCSDCGEIRTEAIPMLTHIHQYSTVVTSPTCTEQGYTTHICANDAAHNYVDNHTAALGHNFTTSLDHKDPTSKENGYDVFKCTRCNETKTDIIPATGGSGTNWFLLLILGIVVITVVVLGSVLKVRRDRKNE
jgi:LPXTG-motif cell wall-anchored protein